MVDGDIAIRSSPAAAADQSEHDATHNMEASEGVEEVEPDEVRRAK